MKKMALCLLLGVMPHASDAAEAAAPIPKEGKGSFVAVASGTAKALPLGKDRVQIAYEVAGVITSDNGEGPLNNASFRCLGGMHVANGEYNDDSAACVYTRPDGDQVFAVNKGTGKRGAAAKVTITYVGGTGKLAGIQGGAEATRTQVRPAGEGMAQSITRGTFHYKLP